jgi:hypothetical protein
VVRADAAVAVAIQGRGVAAVSAVPLAGDEIDEGGVRDLLHRSLKHCRHNVGPV